MIQELLGAINYGGLDHHRHKFSFNPTILEATLSPSSSPPPSSSSSSSSSSGATTTVTTANNACATTTTPPATTNSTASENQSLRCPRCDSSNTKFCYYNNYNLTQPRHFCKTCRRYWTKGGALRNVPIGGGCRKNKNITLSTSITKSSAAAKLKSVVSEIGRSSLANGFDHEQLPSIPFLWTTSPHNSHILALLRPPQNPSTTTTTLLSNPVSSVKEEVGLIGSHSPMMTTEPAAAVLSSRALGVDPHSQVPSLGLSSSLWKTTSQNQTQQNGFVVGEEQTSTGIQELYQRLKSSASTYYNDNSAGVHLSNMACPSSSTSCSSSSYTLESAPMAASELGYSWNNPAFSWADLSATNGAYPL